MSPLLSPQEMWSQSAYQVFPAHIFVSSPGSGSEAKEDSASSHKLNSIMGRVSSLFIHSRCLHCTQVSISHPTVLTTLLSHDSTLLVLLLSGDSPLFPIFSMSFFLFLSLAFLPLLLLLPTSLLHSSSCVLCLPPSFLSLGFPSLVHP